VRTRLAVGRVIVYKSRGLDKTGGPFSYHTSLEPGYLLYICTVYFKGGGGDVHFLQNNFIKRKYISLTTYHPFPF
jgi:hypothetical protein